MQPQRLDLCYEIIWKGRWHVGSGYQSAVADRLLRRIDGVDKVPFVPGSQIKGALRHQCERLAIALDLEAINPHAVTKDDEQSLVKHFTPLANSDLIADRLFGTRYQGECLFVTNAMPVSSDSEKAVSIQTRTAIDRVTRTVMENHLFTTELAEGDVKLQGKIRGRHSAGVLTQDSGEFPYEYSLLVAALLSLDTLGGDKSVGLGRCKVKLKDQSLYWNGKLIPQDNAFQNFQNEKGEAEEEWGTMIELLREEQTA